MRWDVNWIHCPKCPRWWLVTLPADDECPTYETGMEIMNFVVESSLLMAMVAVRNFSQECS